MTRAVLFDFDGVIIQSEEHHRQALTDALAESGITLDRASYYRDHIGLDDRTCIQRAFAHAGQSAPPHAIETTLHRKVERYLDALDRQVAMVPGVGSFVEAVAALGWSRAVVSGARRAEIELVLERTGLARWFQCIVSADDVHRSKPDPSGYRKAMATLGQTPAQCVAIEDSTPGLNAARGAGLRCAMLTTSSPATELRQADLIWPDFVDRRPHELPWLAAP